VELEFPGRIADLVHVSKSIDELFDFRPAQCHADGL